MDNLLHVAKHPQAAEKADGAHRQSFFVRICSHILVGFWAITCTTECRALNVWSTHLANKKQHNAKVINSLFVAVLLSEAALVLAAMEPGDIAVAPVVAEAPHWTNYYLCL